MISRPKSKEFDWMNIAYMYKFVNINDLNLDNRFTYLNAKKDLAETQKFYPELSKDAFIINFKLLRADIIKELFRD